MRQILTSVIAIFWMAAFGVMAITAAAGGENGLANLFGMLGAPVAETAGHPTAAGLFAILFALVAALFLWMFLTAFFGDHATSGAGEEVARMAVGLAMVVLALVLVVGGVVERARGVFIAVAVILAALAGSYLVVAAERFRSVLWTEPESDDIRAAARLMAAGAAHNSMLDRLSGRSDGYLGGGRP